MFEAGGLAEMIRQSDWIIVTAPLTPETRGMIGEPEFRAMKPTARFINVTRGEIADPVALERALTEGWIAGAGLDAHHIEPLPDDSILWDLPNVLVTPHNASTSTASKARAIESLAANLRLFGHEEPLIHTIDRSAGY
jgi:phosphoglycerate dehydrogenase-like enzyme